MKKIFIVLFLIHFIGLNMMSQGNKKVVIELYEDGTWSKVADVQKTPIIVSIEETFQQFQAALKSKDKNKVAEFFDFPFYLDVLDAQHLKEYLSNYYALKGSISRSKLIENYDIIFDKSVSYKILKVKQDEYSKSDPANPTQKRQYSFDLFETKENNKIHTYSIRFVLIDNKFKIDRIFIGYVK